MRSINGKLTISFLIVGILGALLVSWVINMRAQQEFGQFAIRNHERSLARQLQFVYQANDSWNNIGHIISRRDRNGGGNNGSGNNNNRNGNSDETNRGFRPRRFYGVLANADGNVLVVEPPQARPTSLTENERERATTILVDNAVVGYLISTPPPDLLDGQLERFFLQRFGLSVVLGALGGALLALVAGAFLARTLTKPIHELTEATESVAEGNLGHQVAVSSQDEIGQLADAFNSMSAQLAKADDQRQQMTADIAHDLRTPLSVILGYTEALNDGKLQGNSDMYEVLHRQAQHLSHLVEELRTLSLADAGKLTLNKQSVSVAGLLEETQMAHQVEANDQGVSIELNLPESLPTISLDRDRMTQVLGNLVKNALHHTPDGGTITLGATERGGAMEVFVADTGSGIAADDLPSIFERFYRADKNRTAEGASGLGLSIAKSIVEAHGGEISVGSGEGKGATFIIKLPLEEGRTNSS